MNIRLIDTSIMLNLLGVPKRNSQEKEIREEFLRVIKTEETLILPMATIIETGNEIARISGSRKREIAVRFADYLRKTANGEAPWSPELTEIKMEDLKFFADEFVSSATIGVGMGDLSIIRTYEKCRAVLPADRIMIWSTDKHLSSYKEEKVYSLKRRK